MNSTMYGRVNPLSIWLTSLLLSARAMVEDTVLDKACVNKRIKRLCEKASLSELVQTETYLRNLVDKDSGSCGHNNKPTGSKETLCKGCRGLRPPAPRHQPWHARKKQLVFLEGLFCKNHKKQLVLGLPLPHNAICRKGFKNLLFTVAGSRAHGGFTSQHQLLGTMQHHLPSRVGNGIRL